MQQNNDIADLINMVKNFDMDGSQKRRRSFSLDSVVDRKIKKEEVSEDDSNTMTDSTCIKDVVIYIFKVILKIPLIKIDKWVTTLEHNLIINLGILKRQNPDTIQRLHLPLALETELKKIITEKQTDKVIANYSDINEDVKNRIKKSWKHVTKEKERLNSLYDIFYKKWLQLDKKAAKELEDTNIEVRSRKLLTIISLCLKYIDNKEEIEFICERLAIVHLIKNIATQNFSLIAKAISETLFEVIDLAIMDNSLKNTWCFIINDIGQIIMSKYDTIRNGRTCLIYTRKHKKWYKSYCKITHDKITCVKFNKNELLYDVNIKDIIGIENIEEDDHRIIKITPFCISLKVNDDEIFFCVEEKQAINILYDEIDVRNKYLF